jgi:CBS domain-containing protein
LRVQDVMNANHPLIYINELATKARAILREFRLRVLPVVDEHRELLGVIARNDVMTISSSVSPVRARGIMSNVRFAAIMNQNTIEAAREMMRMDESYVPVVKSPQDNIYVGMLGLEHIFRELYQKKTPKLKTLLSDVMTTKRIMVCSPHDESGAVWQKMKERTFAACPVVVKGKPIGVLSQQDLLESGGVRPQFEATKGRFKNPSTIFTIMKTPPVSLTPNNTVEEAIGLMLQRDIGRVTIINEKGLLVGIVDREDVLRAIIP